MNSGAHWEERGYHDLLESMSRIGRHARCSLISSRISLGFALQYYVLEDNFDEAERLIAQIQMDNPEDDIRDWLRFHGGYIKYPLDRDDPYVMVM